MMSEYNLRIQRDVFMASMRNDVRLKEYPKADHCQYLDQYAAKKVFKKKWDSIVFRLLFNISLPLIFAFSNIYIPIKYIFKFVRRRKLNVYNIHRLFICCDSHLCHISKRAGLQKDSDFWFKTFSDSCILPQSCHVIYVEDLITLEEIFKSAWQAFIIHLQTIINLGYDKYFLSYNAYEWCLCDFALRHIQLEAELIYSNIYDRMAILFDALPHANKVMIQHGGMFMKSKIIKDSPYYEWQNDINAYIVRGFYKSSPSKVYYLSEKDKVALSRSVIANSPEYIYMGYGFVPNLLPNRKSVLIVGHYDYYYKNEVFIINELKGLEIDLYLKSHPSINDSLYDSLRKEATNFFFLEGKCRVFPKVDVVISYESTLAYEYESLGTKVLYYDDINLHEIREIIAEILKL